MSDTFGSIAAFTTAILTVTVAVAGFDLVFAFLARVGRAATGDRTDD